MGRINLIMSAGLLMLIGAGACTQYLEKPTPSGQVVASAPVKVAEPYRNPYAPAPNHQAPVSYRSSEMAHEAGPMFSSAVAEDFRLVYQAAGSPKMAIFLNRELSDEVREWFTEERLVVSFDGKFEQKSGEDSASVTGPGGVSVYGQTHLEEGRRLSPNESWMWRFEDGFLDPFLNIGTNIVDRAAIMRLAAAESGKQGSAYEPITVKKIEMSALIDSADLYVEILIRAEPSSALGYEFKASAKEVATGRIRANVTSLDWRYGADAEPFEKVVATSTGYEFVKVSPENKLPKMNVISRDLALSLMRALADNWRQ